MTLEDKVMAAMKSAMKNKAKAELRGLRAIKSAILLEKTSGGDGEFDEIRLLQKLVKQRQDSLEIYEKQGREDLATTEREEIDVIQKFLPEQLGTDELKSIVEEIIQQTGASGMKDMGKVMGATIAKVAGQADGKAISQVVKSLLS